MSEWASEPREIYLLWLVVVFQIQLSESSLQNQALVTCTCNPSYLRGRDQEDHGSKPTWANSLQDLSRKYPTPNRAGRVAQVVECLPSKCEASGPPKRKEEEEEKGKKFPFWLLTRPHLSP
jgi:hypothetical protein